MAIPTTENVFDSRRFITHVLRSIHAEILVPLLAHSPFVNSLLVVLVYFFHHATHKPTAVSHKVMFRCSGSSCCCCYGFHSSVLAHHNQHKHFGRKFIWLLYPFSVVSNKRKGRLLMPIAATRCEVLKRKLRSRKYCLCDGRC